jgi:hypothetical protein
MNSLFMFQLLYYELLVASQVVMLVEDESTLRCDHEIEAVTRRSTSTQSKPLP